MDYEYFMKEALKQARKALDAGEFPVGCVLVHQDRVVATGARKGTSGKFPNEIEHAEMIALKQLSDMKIVANDTKIVLFTTMEPCLMCLGAMMLSGISEVVYAYEDVMGGGTRCDLSKMTPLYKLFFNNPENSYWQNSLLAEYTIGQE